MSKNKQIREMLDRLDADKQRPGAIVVSDGDEVLVDLNRLNAEEAIKVAAALVATIIDKSSKVSRYDHDIVIEAVFPKLREYVRSAVGLGVAL